MMPVAKGGHLIRGNDIRRFWSKTRIDPKSGCIVWTASVTQDGYGKFSTGPAGKQKTTNAHRWIYEHIFGPVGALRVRHSCDTPACVTLQHLEPGTQQQNIAEINARGRRKALHWKAILSVEVVTLIKEELRRGDSNREIADRYNVSTCVISHIAKGRNWKHVK